jgi:predicted lipoprotein
VKRILVRWTGLIAITTLVGLGVLAVINSTTVRQFFVEKRFNRVLKDYTGKMVMPTITRAVQEIGMLEKAVARLQAEPNDSNLEAAADAWRKARACWLQTSAMGFGPMAYYNFDKQLETFPLDRPLVEHLIGEMAAGRVQVDERYLREEEHSSMRGFLAAEYLLFRDGKPRRAQDLSTTELDYLVAVTRAMTVESTDFEASWAGSSAISSSKAALLKTAGMKTWQSYAYEFEHPGASDSRYLSYSASLQEIAQDLAGISEELCPAITEVLGSSDPRDSRTWYSNNGPDDLLNMLKGLENSYLGGMAGKRGHSFSRLLILQDDVLDRRIRIALADTAYRITEAGNPYGEHRDNRELLVRRAEAACLKLADRLAVAALMVITDPSTRPHAAYGQ